MSCFASNALWGIHYQVQTLYLKPGRQDVREDKMAAIAFDTLKFARKLKEAGVPEQQAEAQASDGRNIPG